MPETKVLELRCRNCSTWFPSPFWLGGDVVFDTATMEGNLAQCPACGKVTASDKENMQVRFADEGGNVEGGFVGDKT